MGAVAAMWQTDRSRLIGWVGVAVAVGTILLNLDFFFRAGTSDVLTGFAYNGFVLGLFLVLTAGSRTVSLPTLGIYWLLGVWVATGLAYVLQQAMIGVSGVDRSDAVVAVWYASITEETLKPLAVVLFFVIAARREHRWPSISDGLLLGFMVGWGLKFHEDAHIDIVTGHGWGTLPPLSTFLPTIELWNDQVYSDHAVRGALEGLSVGAAAMLWSWRRREAWLVGLAGPFVMFWGHVIWNYFVDHPGQAVGSEDAPFLFATVQDLLAGGRVPVALLLIGAVAGVVAELWILRRMGKRDPIFQPLPFARLRGLAGGWSTSSGRAQLMAAEQYVTLRRSVYYAGWRTEREGDEPIVTYADYYELDALAATLEAPPSVAAVPAIDPAAAAVAPDVAAGDGPPAG